MSVPQILVVEDNPIDLRLLHHAFERLKAWPVRVNAVNDGERAINYLLQQGEYGEAVRPDLVILDLNLPKRDGTEVLRAIRNEDGLRGMIVFVLSSSPLHVMEDKLRSANVHADSYFTKPYEFGTFASLVGEIQRRFEILRPVNEPLALRLAAGTF